MGAAPGGGRIGWGEHHCIFQWSFSRTVVSMRQRHSSSSWASQRVVDADQKGIWELDSQRSFPTTSASSNISHLLSRQNAELLVITVVSSADFLIWDFTCYSVAVRGVEELEKRPQKYMWASYWESFRAMWLVCLPLPKKGQTWPVLNEVSMTENWRDCFWSDWGHLHVLKFKHDLNLGDAYEFTFYFCWHLDFFVWFLRWVMCISSGWSQAPWVAELDSELLLLSCLRLPSSGIMGMCH